MYSPQPRAPEMIATPRSAEPLATPAATLVVPQMQVVQPATPSPVAMPAQEQAPEPQPIPVASPWAETPRMETTTADVIVRVAVRAPEGPYDDPHAARTIIDAILRSGLATFVHDQETIANYMWNGAVVRKPQTVLEIFTQGLRTGEVMKVVRDLHPDRNPHIQVITCMPAMMG